jgi:hypothetical protein
VELIILSLGGSIGVLLSQLLEFISQWRSATHRPPLHRHRPHFECNAGLQANLQTVAFRQRLPSRSA